MGSFASRIASSLRRMASLWRRIFGLTSSEASFWMLRFVLSIYALSQFEVGTDFRELIPLILVEDVLRGEKKAGEDS